MANRFLIVQSDAATAQTLTKLIAARGDQVWQASDSADAIARLTDLHPNIVMIDLHLAGVGWLELLRLLRRQYPDIRVIITNKHPDFQRELLAKEQGVRVFLREPFTQHWLEQAINRLQEKPQDSKAKSSRLNVKIPVRVKITLPYMLLALLFALVGAYLVTQVVMGSIEDRFKSQLVATGKQNADWMVQEENRLLETERLVANTNGIAALVTSGDAEKLRQLALPLAVNSKEEALEVLDTQGTSLLSLRHTSGGKTEDYTSSRGDQAFSQWDFVRYVLDGHTDQGQDKNSGIARAAWGNYFYVDGPIYDGQGKLVGVVLVGKTMSTLVRQMHDNTLADVSLYGKDGQPIASTLATGIASLSPLPANDASALLAGKAQSSLSRDFSLASNQYSEILGPWEARGGQNLGLMGTSLPRLFVTTTNQVTRTQIFILVAIMFVLVIFIGVSLADTITRPLLRIVRASSDVSRGNLDVKVDVNGNDEVTVLARSFNSMVAGLQEGSMYRDLLGRTVSPEVREQLRQTFTSGNLRLEGQEAVATVLMSDIRGFTNLCEKCEPATIFHWLNEYFGELVPIMTANNGVVNKFDGDAMLAFFGILPKMLSPKQSAYSACQAALQILAGIERLNLQRMERGDPPLSTGIGINTGMVTAGGLGTSDRLHYTIIGDTVNSTQRLEALTRQLFNVSGVVISQSTYMALGEYRSQFRLDPLGNYMLKGKSEQLSVYRLLPLTEAANGQEATSIEASVPVKELAA